MADSLDETVTGGESFAIPSLANLRDIGGCRSSFGGVVRRGVVFRSTDLSRLTDTDLETLDALSIATVFDLRTLEEQQARPDRVPDGARHLGAAYVGLLGVDEFVRLGRTVLAAA